MRAQPHQRSKKCVVSQSIRQEGKLVFGLQKRKCETKENHYGSLDGCPRRQLIYLIKTVGWNFGCFKIV